MGIDGGVMHAHIGQAADQNYGGGLVTAQNGVQISVEEGRVTAFTNFVFACQRSELVNELRSGRSVDAVQPFCPVDFASQVDQRGMVDFADEDHRDPAHPSSVDQRSD